MTDNILTREEVEARFYRRTEEDQDWSDLYDSHEALRSAHDALAARCGRLEEALRQIRSIAATDQVMRTTGELVEHIYTVARAALAEPDGKGGDAICQSAHAEPPKVAPCTAVSNSRASTEPTSETSAAASPREEARKRLRAWADEMEQDKGFISSERILKIVIKRIANLRLLCSADVERDRRLVTFAAEGFADWLAKATKKSSPGPTCDELLAAFAESERQRGEERSK